MILFFNILSWIEEGKIEERKDNNERRNRKKVVK